MMNKGDFVEVLDEAIAGEIVELDAERVIIKTQEGFELAYKPNEVIKVETDKIEVNYQAIEEAIKDKQTKKKIKKRQVKRKERNLPPMEIDLHIHQLTSSVKNLSNFDMLNIQLETAQRQLEFAIKKRIQKVVFIHGVGEGVLKTELATLFNRYDNVKYYDADYKKYGLGATEVYIFQNA